MRKDTLRGRRPRAAGGNGKTPPPKAGKCLTVGPQEFCELAISPRKLVRCDDRAVGLRGLRDVETGEQFLVPENELFVHSVADA